jgi:hypothetical protein
MEKRVGVGRLEQNEESGVPDGGREALGDGG